MAGKRKADDNLTGTRHLAARTEPTAGDDLAGTSAQTSGPTANAAGDGIAGTSQALAGLTAATTGSAGGSSQFGGVLGSGAWSGQRGRGLAPPHRQTFPGKTATTPAFSVGGAARGAGGGSGYRGFSQPQPHRRAPSQGMLRPPLGNPPGGRPAFTYQYHNQIAGPLQTGTGHSGSSGPSSAITSASAPGAPVPVSPLVEACPRCKRPPTFVFSGCAPFCVDCYAKIVLSNVLQKHPEIRYVHPPPGAAAIRPSSSSSSSSAVGSGPICPACGHPLGTGNRACRFCHSNGPPPPGLG
ncbi:probable glycoprotein hormone G-protein coupled receptor [Triticum aestivum]|uniref:probable glycoprotein hormone G-protein coupled receptor n=1 Tax=Triticum aestivum TaxID=4565 RepID=UPI001D0038C1|nr:probable glycoprotein hormone G-protein coupled receptor [Triticum aestivum]